MQNNLTNFGAQWNGSPQYATQRQLLSTSFGLETEISTIVASGAVNTWATFSAINNVNMAGFSLLSTNTVSTMTLNVSSINGANINVGGIVINNSTITNGGTTINGGNITNNNTTTTDTTKSKTYTVSDVVTSAGAAIDSITDSVEALGGVFSAAEGAAQIASVAYGVGTIANGVSAANGVVDLATKAASLFTTRTQTTISGNAVPGQTVAVYETINGTTQLQFSTLNTATTTVFRTTDRANPNQKFGNETFISTIIPAGTKCARSVSDPLQFQMISTQLISTNNFLQSYGQWTAILNNDDNLNATTASISTLTTSNANMKLINNSITLTGSNLSNVGQFYANNGIFGNAIGVTANAQVGSLTSLGAVSGTSGSFSGNVGVNNLTAVGAVNGATAVFSGSIQGGSLYTPNNTVTGTLTVTTAAGMGSLVVSGAASANSLTVTGTAAAATVNATTTNTTGVTTSGAVSTNTLSTAVSFISSINGINVDALGVSPTTLPFLSVGTISSGTITAGAISTLAISSGTITAGAISTTSLSTAVSFISSINGVSFASLVNPLPTETVSTFQQLFTSSFVASNINTNVLQTNQLITSSILGNNISTGLGYINQLNTSSFQALNISTGIGYINQLNTSSIQALNISTGIGYINKLNASSIGVTGGLVFSTPSTVADISKFTSLFSLTGSNLAGYKNNILNYEFDTSVVSQPTVTYPFPTTEVEFFWSQVGTWGEAINTFQAGGVGFITIILGVSTGIGTIPVTGFCDFYNQFQTGGIRVLYLPGISATVPLGSTYRFSWTLSGAAWTVNTSPSPISVLTQTNFNISQDFAGAYISTSDVLSMDATSIFLNAPYTQANKLNAGIGLFSTLQASYISSLVFQGGAFAGSNATFDALSTNTISTATLTGSNILTTNLTGTTINALTANTTSLNGATILCSTLTTSNIQNADAVLVQKFQGNTPLSFNALTNQYVTLSGGLSGTNARAQTNQINFLALPGMVDAGIPPGYPANTTLTFTAAGKSLLIGNPGFPSLWYSSITSVDNSLNAKIVNFQAPTGGNGEVALLTNGINNVTVQSNATNFGVITTIGYSKLSWNAGVFSIVNAGSYSPYLSTMVTQDTRIQTGANNAMNLINKQTLFNGKAPVIFYQNFTGFFVGTPGSASGSGVLSYNGSNFATNQWSCYLSFYNINLAQNNLAINNFNVTTTAFGSNWGAYCYTGVATAVNGATSNVNWNVQAIMVPKEFSLQQNFNKFGEEAPEQDLPPSTFTSTISFFSRLELPEILVSSITASTINFEASQNMALLSGIAIPSFFGTGNILVAGTASVEIAGDQAVVGGLQDVNIAALSGSVYLSGNASIEVAANTMNFSTSVMNFDATTTLSNVGDFDLYAAGRIRLYSPWINIEDTTGNIINFQSNVYDSFTNIGDQRIKYGTISGSNIFTIRNITGDIDLEGSNVTRTLSGVQIGQPVLQYGEASSSGNNGSVVITLPTAYTSAASYVAFVSMMDADPAEMSVVRNTSSEIEIFWAQAGGGSHTIAWNTMGT